MLPSVVSANKKMFPRRVDAAVLWQPYELGERRSTLGLFVAMAVALATALLVRIWLKNQSINISLAGFFMVSDAGDHYECARHLDWRGSLEGQEWCQRRPLYAALLAGFSALAGRLSLGMMLLQAAMLGVSVFVLARAVSRQLGLIAAACAFVLMFAYGREHALSQIMSENAGLMFGAVGLAFLLHGAATDGERRRILIGTALVSIALFARAGPILTLPLIAAWAMLTFRHQGDGWRLLAGLVVAVLAGPMLQAVVSLLAGADVTNAQSNFAYTLYGLAMGGRGWGAVFEDHPYLAKLSDAAAAKEIYALAFKKLTQDPGLFFTACAKNVAIFLRHPLFDVPGSQIGGLPNLLWWFGALAIFIRRKSPVYTLVGWINLGVALSAAVIAGDGGPRVYAATFGAQVLQASLGAVFVLQTLVHGLPAAAMLAMPPGIDKPDTLRSTLAILLLLLVLFPVTPLRLLAPRPFAADLECPAGLRSVIVRPGRETYQLAITNSAQPADVFWMKVARERFERRLAVGDWVRKDFLALDTPVTVYRAWPINSLSSSEVRFYVDADASGYAYKTVHACIDERLGITLAGLEFHRAVSMTVVGKPVGTE